MSWESLLIGKDPTRNEKGMYIDPEERLRYILESLGARHRSSYGVFWGRVRDLTYLGSTYAVALCRWAGLDPITGKQDKR